MTHNQSVYQCIADGHDRLWDIAFRVGITSDQAHNTLRRLSESRSVIDMGHCSRINTATDTLSA